MKATVRQNEQMQIRDASNKDQTALHEMWQQFMTELHGGRTPTTEETDLWETRLQSQIRRKQVVVADDGQRIQGFAGFIDHADRPFVPSTVALIVDLYVAPPFRKREIGATLLHHITQRAMQNGCEKAWTNTEEWNQPAQRCLTTSGFDTLNGFELPGLKGQRYYRMDLKR